MSQDSRHRVAIVGGTGMWGQRYLRVACRRDDVEALRADLREAEMHPRVRRVRRARRPRRPRRRRPRLLLGGKLSSST